MKETSFDIINLPYSMYVALSDEKKKEIDFILSYSDIEEKDYYSTTKLEDREFGFVKQLMECFINDELEELAKLIFSLPEYDEKKILSEPIWKVLISMKFLVCKINELIEIEGQMLTPSVQGEDYSGYIEQVDFSMFNNEYTQTRELANNDILKFEEIRKQPYKNCLVELIYRQKQNDLEKLIMNSKKNK